MSAPEPLLKRSTPPAGLWPGSSRGGDGNYLLLRRAPALKSPILGRHQLNADFFNR
jgi:hypothetical protein